MEQKFPLRRGVQAIFPAVRLAQCPQFPLGDLVGQAEIVAAQHVDMLVQQRREPRDVYDRTTSPENVKIREDIVKANRMGGDIGDVIVRRFSNDVAAATTAKAKRELGDAAGQNVDLIQRALGASTLSPDAVLRYRVELAFTIVDGLTQPGNGDKLRALLAGLAKDARSVLKGDRAAPFKLIDKISSNTRNRNVFYTSQQAATSLAFEEPRTGFRDAITNALYRHVTENVGFEELTPAGIAGIGGVAGPGVRGRTRSGSCNSFTPTTPVRTLSGLVAIAALTIGTPVLAFNESTGENGYYPITAVHQNIDPAITYLTLNDGQTDQPEAITTTPEHPFYVAQQVDSSTRPAPVGHEDLNEHWVGAGHLQIGDKIKQADGTLGVVANVVTVQQTRQMFNLTVDEAHTFYVGTAGWLVHNCPSETATAIASQAGKHDSMVKHVLVQGDMQGMGLRTREQLANYVDDVIGGSDTYTKSLSGGRTAYLDPRYNTVVVVNPKTASQGTIFRPGDGSTKAAQDYFFKLK